MNLYVDFFHANKSLARGILTLNISDIMLADPRRIILLHHDSAVSYEIFFATDEWPLSPSVSSPSPPPNVIAVCS